MTEQQTPTDDALRPGTVAIGYCTGQTSVTPEFASSMMAMTQLDSRLRGGRIQNVFGLTASGPGVPKARNQIVELFLDTKTEWLLFLDTDATFHPTLLDHLLAAADPQERPIVGGLSFRTTYSDPNEVGARVVGCEPMIYAFVPQVGHYHPLRKYPKNSAFKIDALPTHCLLIHRRVLEDPAWQDDPLPWFRFDVLNGKHMGEDIYFCHRARQLGYPIYVNTSAKTGHVKNIVIDEEFYERLHPGLFEDEK